MQDTICGDEQVRVRVGEAVIPLVLDMLTTEEEMTYLYGIRFYDACFQEEIQELSAVL